MRRFPDKAFMPVAIDVRNKKVLLIGGGRIAMHKIESLKKYARNIHVVALEVSSQIKNAKGISFIEKEYEPSDLKGAFIVYACTNIRELNQRVMNDAHEQNIMVNVVDSPADCDFVSPAIYRHCNVSIAVSSNGEDVMKSIAIRNKIKTIAENDKSFFI